jgi:hypothetical protein
MKLGRRMRASKHSTQDGAAGYVFAIGRAMTGAPGGDDGAYATIRSLRAGNRPPKVTGTAGRPENRPG